MKLKLFGIDFIENTICFRVPASVMQEAEWKGGFADVELGGICSIANEPTTQVGHGKRGFAKQRGVNKKDMSDKL